MQQATSTLCEGRDGEKRDTIIGIDTDPPLLKMGQLRSHGKAVQACQEALAAAR